MNSRRALALVLMAHAVYGAAVGYFFALGMALPRGMEAFLLLAIVIPVYLWYWHDPTEMSYPRTMALGGAVILIALLAVPYYLLRSRPKGARAQALLRFAAFFVLSWALTVATSVLFEIVPEMVLLAVAHRSSPIHV